MQPATSNASSRLYSISYRAAALLLLPPLLLLLAALLLPLLVAALLAVALLVAALLLALLLAVPVALVAAVGSVVPVRTFGRVVVVFAVLGVDLITSASSNGVGCCCCSRLGSAVDASSCFRSFGAVLAASATS
eukprot:COSAG06_NODE_20168_length_802_cov_57.990085_1_plen_134_part_00